MATTSHCVAFRAWSAPSSCDMAQASSRTSTVMIRPAPLIRATCMHSRPMLPWPKHDDAYRRCAVSAVSTAATLSLSDCRQAASLSEMRSSTLTSAISGSRASSEKQPGRSKPITGPLRQSALRLAVAQRAILAGQLGPGGDPIARPIAGHSLADFDDAGTELVAEKLDRRFAAPAAA